MEGCPAVKVAESINKGENNDDWRVRDEGAPDSLTWKYMIIKNR